MKTVFTLFAACAVSIVYSQEPIDVTDQTLKIGGLKEEILYFGFAEGDQIVLNFTEIDGKELKEIEVSEYPSPSKYTDFKTARIENKTIAVNHKGVYQFRFSNGAVGGRICKIRIQRIPANDQTTHFNTNVTWIQKQDTTWNTYTKDVLVGYDTTYRQMTKKELVKTEVREELLMDKDQRVHTYYNANGDKTYLYFTLPASQMEYYKTSKVIAWAYWIGVGQEAANAWVQNAESIAGLATDIVGTTSPLGALAIGMLTTLVIPKSGDDVYYALTDESNKALFMAGQTFQAWDNGKGRGGYKKFVDPGMCRGSYFLVLSNDNIAEPINVAVKVVAIVETKTYEDKEYTEELVKPRYEKQIFSDPVIKTRTVPVIGI